MKLCDHQPYIEHLLTEIDWLKNELAVAQGKVDRMECAIMPLSSSAGVAYIRGQVDHGHPPAAEAPFSRWASMQAENDARVREEEARVDGLRREEQAEAAAKQARTNVSATAAIS